MAAVANNSDMNIFARTQNYINDRPTLRVALAVSAISTLLLLSAISFGAALPGGALFGLMTGLSVKVLAATSASSFALAIIGLKKGRSKEKDLVKEVFSDSPYKDTSVYGPRDHEMTAKYLKGAEESDLLIYHGAELFDAGKMRDKGYDKLPISDPRAAFIHHMTGDFVKTHGVKPADSDSLAKLGLTVKPINEDPSIELKEFSPDRVIYEQEKSVMIRSKDPEISPREVALTFEVTISKDEDGKPTKITSVRKTFEMS